MTTTVGVRELKAQLSRHLKRVRDGTRLTVTDRGRAIATIGPVDAPDDIDQLHGLVSEGLSNWEGGKPAGAKRPVRLKGGRLVSEAVLEDRG